MHRDAFFRFYANLPIGVRREVVLVLPDRGPITWEVAYREIKENTDLGKVVLQKLIELGFVPLEEKQKIIMEEKGETQTISDDIINLVISRLETIPSNIELSVGGEGSFSIKELIKRVRKQDDIGKKIIEMQLAYLRSLSKLPIQELQNAAAAN